MLDNSFRLRYKAVPLATSIMGKAMDNTPVHNHSEFEILFITKGTSTIRINNTTYTAKKGDMFFVNPLEIHSVTREDKENYSHTCVCFDCSLISDSKISDALMSEALHIQHYIKNGSPHSVKLKNFFTEIIKSHEAHSEYTKTEISAYISLMFTYLLKNSLTDKKTSKNKNEIFCSKVSEYISQNYSEDITSKKIAHDLSYNQSYFCRMFKKNFNSRFSDYLNMYRISMSRILLEEGGSSVTQIAIKCGFNTPSYFAKCFKKAIGILPSEYLKNQ